jgi:hypothetical protein
VGGVIGGVFGFLLLAAVVVAGLIYYHRRYVLPVQQAGMVPSSPATFANIKQPPTAPVKSSIGSYRQLIGNEQWTESDANF